MRIPSNSTLILDGGLATELEAMGHNLRHRLWSAKLLLEDPEAIAKVHRAYLEAGADIITSASYQATIPALMETGLSRKQSGAVMAFSVELAKQAVLDFQARGGGEGHQVMASLGPYGAFLADGSEFRGRYGMSKSELRSHHLQQWEIMRLTDADGIAFETVPDFQEAEVLADIFRDDPEMQGWISFSCRDGKHLNDGTPIREVVELVEGTPGLIGLGINCTAPVHVASLLMEAKAGGLSKPAIVYPNSGEVFDPKGMGWKGQADLDQFASQAKEWQSLGARVIGGCCRTRPGHIRMLKEILAGKP